MLRLSPANRHKPEDELRLFIPGSLLERNLSFRSAIKLYASPNNSGAAEVAHEMRLAFRNIQVQLEAPCTARTSRKPGRLFSSCSIKLLTKSQPVETVAKTTSAVAQGAWSAFGSIMSAAMRPSGSDRKPGLLKKLPSLIKIESNEYFLVLLNEQTFQGEAGETLASEIANALHSNFNVVLVHEKDPKRHACSFDVIIQT